jgi:hypothetical protein
MVHYWSRSEEGKVVTPETAKNHFGKTGIRGILLGEPGYRNPWVTGCSIKYFAYVDYDKIYDFEEEHPGYVQLAYRRVRRTGGRLIPEFENLILSVGYSGYIRHGEIKYFFPLEIHRDYDIESASPRDFYESISKVRSEYVPSGFDKQLTPYSVEDYESMKLFLGKYKDCGFALDGDNIVSVFSHPILSPGALPNLMDMAVRNGGRRVDVFDTYLPKLYSREGFRSVARILWNDLYSPKGWNYEFMKQFNGGRPDVVFMVYDPESKVPLVGTCDEAEEIQKQFVV